MARTKPDLYTNPPGPRLLGGPKRKLAREKMKVDLEEHYAENPLPEESAIAAIGARADEYHNDPQAKKHRRAMAHPLYSAKMQRQFTPDKKAIFIKALAECGNMALSAEAVGISSSTASSHKNPNSPQYDSDFAAAVEEAHALYNGLVEKEIHRRAIEGTKEPVFGGKDRDRVVGHVVKYSDGLLTTLAKRRMPEYSDKLKVEDARGQTPGTEIAPGLDLAHMTKEQRTALKTFLTTVDGKDRSDVIDGELVKTVDDPDEQES